MEKSIESVAPKNWQTNKSLIKKCYHKRTEKSKECGDQESARGKEDNFIGLTCSRSDLGTNGKLVAR
jgi:hypothetical protein